MALGLYGRTNGSTDGAADAEPERGPVLLAQQRPFGAVNVAERAPLDNTVLR